MAQVRKEYEMLRIEFEQNLAANEQAGRYLHLSRRIYRRTESKLAVAVTVYSSYTKLIFSSGSAASTLGDF